MAHPEMLDAPAPTLRERIEAYGELPTNLPSEDGTNLDSDWHRIEIHLLITCIRQLWRGRTDFYAGGNSFIYFDPEQARSRTFRGPDFYLVLGVDGTWLRDSWVVWNENYRVPDLVIELTSEYTKELDFGPKKQAYCDELRVPNFVIFDRDTQEIHAWRLAGNHYEPIAPDARGRVWLDAVKLSVGLWRGYLAPLDTVWLRFFDASGNLVLNDYEAICAKRLAFREEIRAEAEMARADAETARADAWTALADAEKARADAIEAELERLKRGGR